MKILAKQKNPHWSYQFYFDLVKITALEDDHSTKRTSKTKRTLNAHGTSAGQGCGGRNPTTSGRGNNSGRNSQDTKDKFEKMDKEGATKANIPHSQYKTLPYQAKAVIYKDSSDTTKVNVKFGPIVTPDEIWKKLSSSAKKAIQFHNTNLISKTSTISVHTLEQVAQETTQPGETNSHI